MVFILFSPININILLLVLLMTSSAGGEGRGCAARLFFFSPLFFPCSADLERDWSPCIEVIRVDNQYAEWEKHQQPTYISDYH